MKKRLLAIAVGSVALVPLAAMASGPEFYGRLNVSLDNVAVNNSYHGNANMFGSDGDTFANVAPVITTQPQTSSFPPSPLANSSWNVSSSHTWVGIRGSEPLYDQNLNLIYQVEEQTDLTGNSSNPFTTRNTFVGLAGDNWGKLFLGRYDGIVKQAEGNVDEFNNTVADMALYMGGQNRYDNTINYQTPSYSGLSFHVQLIPGEGRVDLTNNNSSQIPTERGLANGYGASIVYKQDTLYGALAYEKGAENLSQGFAYYGLTPTLWNFSVPSGSPPPVFNSIEVGDIGISTIRLVGGIDIGNIHLGALVQRRKADNLNNIPFASGDQTHSRNDYLISGRYDFTSRLAMKFQAADAGGDFLMQNDNRRVMSYTVGADYKLGKNVTSYVLYSNNSIKGNDPGGNTDYSKYNIASLGLTYNF